ncbi:MAG: AsnC family transcriptional regulator [Thermofilum sp. ex4484_82]|nr:MAG: AsnC family transcriptional regulator [Thermofilum sp. ex4484_82]OYT39742.1 MAG: AsnC family transcriptional regulator [Archaeoglobales archaeon ex4484_92]RLE75886.1 MAG: Lrp/AsnC family transcriptional regulator [Thermoprotei archaeon]RLE84403.1 MAG: Lrp/AsnC family transcriptional regulator [Thermoprotei archaeon]
MTTSAYVLIQVRAGFTIEVAKKVRKLGKVKMAHAVTGPVDVIAYVEIDSLDELGEIINAIHRVEGVERTQTCVEIG